MNNSALTALGYVNRSWFPVPIPHLQKGPKIYGWQKLRITKDTVHQYFNGQLSNIGVLLGEASGLIDVDLDCSEALKLAGQLLPPTGSIFGRASSRSSHRLYTTNEFNGQDSAKHKDTKQKCIVELRCSQGLQTVFPGSTHETGEAIEWELDEEPQNVDLHELAIAVKELAAACLLLRHYPNEGSRHDFALSLAGGLLRQGWLVGKVKHFIEVIATAAGDEEVEDRVRVVVGSKAKIDGDNNATGWPTFSNIIGAEVAKTISGLLCVNTTPHQDSASESSVDKPRSKPKLWRPFPIALLPTPIKNLALEGARSCGVDVAMYVPPIFSSLASAIGTTRRIRIKRTWNEPSILWTANIAPSGAIKSPPFDDATRPLNNRDSQSMCDHEDIILEHEKDLARWDVKSKDWKKNAVFNSDDPPLKPEKPEPTRLVVSDPTIEAVSSLLASNPRGLLLARDELAGWFKSFNSYRGGRGGDTEAWLQMYHGRSMKIDRKTGERHIYCKYASVSVTGTIQPKILRRALTGEYFDAGLAARLLMVMPPRQPRRWSDAELSQQTEYIYDHIITKLLSLEHDVDTDGRSIPRDIEFTPEARQLFIDFYNRHGQLQDTTEDGRLASAFSKLEAVAARLALIFHLVRWADDDPSLDDPDHIGLADTADAIAVTDWLIHETERVYALFTDDEETILANELADWVRLRGGTVTVRDLQLRSRIYENSKDAKNALDDLVERGFGKWEYAQQGPRGGGPSLRFIAATDSNVHNTPTEGVVNGGSVDASTKENEK